MSKRKRTKPAVTKEQAASEGWVYISGSKIIRGWNVVWVEEAAQGGLEPEERTSYCLYSHNPIRSSPPG